MMHFAWIGTGACDPSEVYISKTIQYAAVVVFIVAAILIIKGASRQQKVFNKVMMSLLIVPAFLVCACAIIFASFMGVCTGWSGFF